MVSLTQQVEIKAGLNFIWMFHPPFPNLQLSLSLSKIMCPSTIWRDADPRYGTAKSEFNQRTNLVCHHVSMDVVAVAPFEICLKLGFLRLIYRRSPQHGQFVPRSPHSSICPLLRCHFAHPAGQSRCESPAINIFPAVSPETDL